MNRGLPHITRGFHLAVREMVGIKKPQCFRHPALQIRAVCLKRLHPADIHIPQIHRRIAGVHPFGKRHAGTACRLDADGIKAGGDKEILQLRCLAKDIAVIGGKALGPVEEGLDSRLCQHRKALDSAFEDRLEMVEILGQGVELKILGYAVHAPWLGIRLKGTKQDFAGILLVIGAFVRHPQHRQIRCQPVDPLGHDVEMLTGMQRHRDAGHRTDLARPHAAGINHVIGLDRPLVGHHTRDAAVSLVNVCDLDALNDLRAVITRALGKRLGDVDRIGLAILRKPDAADGVIDCQAGIA